MSSQQGRFLNSKIAQEEEEAQQAEDQTIIDTYIRSLEETVQAQALEIARLRAALKVQNHE